MMIVTALIHLYYIKLYGLIWWSVCSRQLCRI